MNTLRAAGLVTGLGISLAGLYVLSEGITGFVTAQGSFLSIPQIPTGIIIIALGVFGTLFMEHVLSKRIESEEQHVVAAPVSEFKQVAVPQSQLGQESPKKVIEQMKEIDFEEPHTEVVSSEKFAVQFPVVQVENPVVKEAASQVKKKVKRSSIKKKAPVRKIKSKKSKKKR
ncbi:MAG: hypothetical protein AABX51_03250 [Nanoarchaeota archaeon]